MTPPTKDTLSERLKSLAANDPDSVLIEAATALDSLQAQLAEAKSKLIDTGDDSLCNVRRLRVELAEAQKQLAAIEPKGAGAVVSSFMLEVKELRKQLAAKDAEIASDNLALAAAKAEVERLTKCAGCGMPLSNYCPHCKHLWQT